MREQTTPQRPTAPLYPPPGDRPKLPQSYTLTSLGLRVRLGLPFVASVIV